MAVSNFFNLADGHESTFNKLSQPDSTDAGPSSIQHTAVGIIRPNTYVSKRYDMTNGKLFHTVIITVFRCSTTKICGVL